MLNVITLFIFNIVVYNIVLLYGTCGEIMIEKSGSLNLGVEGTMAFGAIVGYLLGCQANSFLVALLGSFVSAAVFGLFFAFLTVTLQANQNVSGLTITTFGCAMYYFIGHALTNSWPALREYSNMEKGFEPLEIPLLSKIPVVGKAFFSHNIFIYLGVLIAILMWVYFEKTRPGLRLKSIGENPAAADSMGVNVIRYKYMHIMLGSGIMGIGGLYMGLNLGGQFEGGKCWIAGYGWISVALVIFSNWNTLQAIVGTFLFGFLNTIGHYSDPLVNQFPKQLYWLNNIPSQFFDALPFVVTLLVLIIDSVRKNSMSNEPKAIGINYYREER